MAGCLFHLLVSPSRARYFSLLRQRKVPKRKAIPEACPLRGFPALLVKPGTRATRCAQTGASVLRALLRCSAAPDGGRVKTGNQHPPAFSRLHSPSTAATPGSRRAPCLRQVYLPSCARPRRGEERRESAPADECAGVPFSLGTFSWALKRKYLAQMGEING